MKISGMRVQLRMYIINFKIRIVTFT